MKYTYTTTFAILTIIVSGLIFTSCESDENNAPDAVMESMQFEAHFSHASDLHMEGSNDYIALQSELGALYAMGPDQNRFKISKIEMNLAPMKEIETLTTSILAKIHQEKERLLKKIGCNACIGKFDPKTGIPIAIQGDKLTSDQEDAFDSKELLDEIIDYRNHVVERLANSHVRSNGGQLEYIKDFNPNLLKKLKLKKDRSDIAKIRAAIATANIDGREGLLEMIYHISPSPDEYKSYSAREGLHFLCIAEARILKARKTVYSLFKMRFSSSHFSFDKIVPVISGPTIAQAGESLEFELSIAAVDSYSSPVVQCAQNASVVVKEGIAYLTTNVDKTTTLTGTISIYNKIGQLKTYDWEKTVTVK